MLRGRRQRGWSCLFGSYMVLFTSQFPYLDATFSEALRVTPPGAFGTIRVAREDFSLGGHRIRKGWLLNVRPACCLLPAGPWLPEHNERYHHNDVVGTAAIPCRAWLLAMACMARWLSPVTT